MAYSKETIRELSSEAPELAVRFLVQVRSDSVWCAIFVQQPEQQGVQAYAQSFERPPERTVDECVERALGRLHANHPADWVGVRRPREEW